MKKVFLTALAVLVAVFAGHAQESTKNNYTGNWEAGASWVDGSAAATANIGAADLDLNIFGFIRRTGNLTFAMNNDTENFIINDTLVVLGNITFDNKAANLRLGPNAVFIVFGNLSATNKITVENGGVFVVTGNMGFSSSDQDDYDDSAGGELYVGGNVNGNDDAEGGEDNWDNLEDDYPGIHDFVECGGGPSCILPVKLSYFVAEVQGEVVELRWATIMEENFRSFVVQRSTDGLSFEDIAELNGRGRDVHSIETKYTSSDVTPFQGVNYYRLKAVDLDGAFEFFQVRMVRVEAARALGVYPNPSTGEEVSFHINFHPEESDRIVLIDQLGVELYNAPATASIKIVFAERLHPGVYFLQYRSKQFEQVKRIIVGQQSLDFRKTY